MYLASSDARNRAAYATVVAFAQVRLQWRHAEAKGFVEDQIDFVGE